jgi:hypothetical protein
MRLLRQRRAAARRDTSDLLGPAVRASLAALELSAEDAGVARLAAACAQTIDVAQNRAAALRWTGPLLLAALEQLGATPAARVRADPPASAAPSALKALRAARASSPV